MLIFPVIGFVANQASATIQYNITDLGTLDGYDGSRVWSINNKGQVAGEAFNWYSNYKTQAVLFDTTGGGKNIELEFHSVEGSGALGINNNGQIVGACDNAGTAGCFYPTTFDSSGSGSIIQSNTEGHSISINDSGQIVGFFGDYFNIASAVLFSNDYQNNIQLGSLDGYTKSIAYSINNGGQIVGYAYNNPRDDERAILFDSSGQGDNIDLGALGGDNSIAAHINNNGQIVGRASTGSEEYELDHAVLFDASNPNNNIDLGILAGQDGSVAMCINNNGQIVGQSWEFLFGFSDNHTAVLFDPIGSRNNIDLNTLIDPTLGWELSGATCINDNGWIVGFGNNPYGEHRAFLLTPVPEPASLLLFGLGGLVFIGKYRR